VTTTAARPLVPARQTSPSRRRRLLVPGWPLVWLLAAFPLWWALGLGQLIFFVAAVPMVRELHRRAPIRVPRGFGWWLLFLVWVVVSLVMLPVNPPGTIPASALHRLGPALLRVAQYFTVTVILLYVGNLSERELPQRRLVRLLALMGVWTIAGGLLGVIVPTFQFTSPVELLLPGSLAQNGLVQSLTHPAAAQLQSVLGYESPRPAAPFFYTNMWGNNLATLLMWFVVAYMVRGRTLSRVGAAIALALAVIPVVYSLNRGLWIGLGIGVLVVVVRLALRGRIVPLAGTLLLLVLGTGAVAASPLHTIFSERLQHGHSNAARTFTTDQAVTVTKESPILGFGHTRDVVGSNQSIAIGRSASCPKCGNSALGINGHLWLLLVTNGFVGAAFYLGFFVDGIWRYRRDFSPEGIAGVTVLVMSLFFILVYNALISPLALYLLSYAVLWRNAMAAEGTLPVEAAARPEARAVST